MTAPPVVCNSSPLIALERVGQLDLLRRLVGEVVVPPAVAREVFADEAPPAWVHVVEPATPLDDVGAAMLGAGEREAIALAGQLGARRLILDDLPARRLAARLGLPVTGTAGLLLAAKRAGLVPAVAPLLDALTAAGFHLSQQVRDAVLAAAGEPAPK